MAEIYVIKTDGRKSTWKILIRKWKHFSFWLFLGSHLTTAQGHLALTQETLLAVLGGMWGARHPPKCMGLKAQWLILKNNISLLPKKQSNNFVPYFSLLVATCPVLLAGKTEGRDGAIAVKRSDAATRPWGQVSGLVLSGATPRGGQSRSPVLGSRSRCGSGAVSLGSVPRGPLSLPRAALRCPAPPHRRRKVACVHACYNARFFTTRFQIEANSTCIYINALSN